MSQHDSAPRGSSGGPGPQGTGDPDRRRRASSNPAKYGNIIVRNLADKGYTVLPINPSEPEIAGPAGLRLACRGTDADRHRHDGHAAAGDARRAAGRRALGLPAVWLQDGQLRRCRPRVRSRAPFKAVYDACIMVRQQR